MFEWIKQLVIYGVLIAGVVAAVIFLPKFSKVAVSENYSDIAGIDMTKDFPLDPTVTVRQLHAGDGIAWRCQGQDLEIAVGWFGGGPGDVIEVDRTGMVKVNGKAFERAHPVTIPPCRLVIPEGYFFAITQSHQLDSFHFGPFPVIALTGKVKGLP